MSTQITKGRSRVAAAVATLAMAAALMLSGCAPSGSEVASIKESDAPAATDGSTGSGGSREAVLDCVRDLGLEPTELPDGGIDLGDAGPEELQKATDKCSKLDSGVMFSAGNAVSGSSSTTQGDGKSQEEYIADMTKFAQCMRDEGIDYPDPDPNGGMTFSTPDDPAAFEAAQKVCKDKTGVDSGVVISED